jgi:2-polyprenyl-6-methoxyphenol hydroxylase-like FAD-dependent oxidoreductase
MTVANHPVGIVGGGPAGLATALALRAYGFEVCVIEQGDWRSARAGEHLAAAARPTLERLGLQSLYERALPCRGIESAWGSDAPQFHDLQLFAPFGGGRIVERPRFDQAMLAHARAQGIRCLERTRVLRATYTSFGHWQITLRSGSAEPETRTFCCLVDASGRAAWLARAQGARVIVYDRLVGVSARAACPSRSNPESVNKLRIWSARDGWWYLATLPGGERVATWMTDVQLVGQLAQREHWHQHCARHFKAHLRLPPQLGAAPWERPRSFPAHSQRLRHPYGLGWIAVGDAALAFDPLSSAGLAKALRGACDAADAIEQSFAGHPEAFSRYEDKLQHDWQRYLDARCDYYRLEQRFMDASFWRDRQYEPASRQTIRLDPQRILHRAPGACAASATQVLAQRMPEVDGQALFDRLAGGELAHDVVRDITARQQLDDHSAIIALQLLLEHGILSSAPAR